MQSIAKHCQQSQKKSQKKSQNFPDDEFYFAPQRPLMQDNKLPSSILRSKITHTLETLASFSTYSDEPTSMILSGFERKFPTSINKMNQRDLASAHTWLVQELQGGREKLLDWKRQPAQDNPLIDDYLHIFDIATPHQVQGFVTEIARAGLAVPQGSWIRYFKNPPVSCITPFGIWFRDNFPESSK